MDKIIGIGNALTDVLVTLESDDLLNKLDIEKGCVKFVDEKGFEELNGIISGMKSKKATGGSAGNTIRALSMLGASCGFIGKVGDDEYGKFYAKSLSKLGVEAVMLPGELSSGVAVTFITPDKQRTFCDYLGSAATLHEGDLTLDMFKGYTCLYVEGYLVQNHDMVVKAMELATQAGLQICLDLASANIVRDDLEFFTYLVNKYVDIVFANEDEAKAFTGLEPEQAIDEIAKACSIAVVKVGKHGAYIKKGTEMIHVPALDVKNVADTTGAGDYFAAGFLYGLLGGYSFEKCGKIGSILSGRVIQTIGASLTDRAWAKVREDVGNVIA